MNTEAAVITSVCKNKDISTILADNVDDIFQSHRDVWEGLKSYYYKFKSVPEVNVLQEKFRDFEPVSVTAETGYYLDRLKNEYLSSRMRNLLMKSGASLKENAASRVLSDMQSEIASLSRLTSNVRDVDLTDYELAEKHILAVQERSAVMGGSPALRLTSRP